MPGKSMILLLAAVAALGSLATQLLVPTLPLIARDLRIGSDQAQLTISVFLIGLGAGQLAAWRCFARAASLGRWRKT
jgi:MFS transporter, DHA1 family, multidrug resistance protein